MRRSDLPIALYPGQESDCFSGQTLVESDRVVAIYHGPGAGNAIATASDPLLLDWPKHQQNPVIPIVPVGDDGSPYRVFDPCIWKDDDAYYALPDVFKNGERTVDCVGVDHLFKSNDLTHREYVGELIAGDYNSETGVAKIILLHLCGHGHLDMAAYDNCWSGDMIDYSLPDDEIAMTMESVPQMGQWPGDRAHGNLNGGGDSMIADNTGMWRIRAADTGLNMFISRIAMAVGVGVTGYLAYPWLANWYFKKWADRLIINDRAVRYTGTPGGITKMWFKVWFYSLITLTVYWWLYGRGAVNRYMDSHLEWADPAQ